MDGFSLRIQIPS